MTPAHRAHALLTALRQGPVPESDEFPDIRNLVAELRQEGHTIVMMHEPGILPGMPSVAVFHMHAEVAG